jgi:hypothetical protein
MILIRYMVSRARRRGAPAPALRDSWLGHSMADAAAPAVATELWASVYQRQPTTCMEGLGMAEPTGVAVLASGMLVVSDCTAQKLFQIDPATGAVVAATGSGATAGERLAEFDRPYDVIAVPALAALQGITTRIEHVGSTSVPGLAAKPTIDHGRGCWRSPTGTTGGLFCPT